MSHRYVDITNLPAACTDSKTDELWKYRVWTISQRWYYGYNIKKSPCSIF